MSDFDASRLLDNLSPEQLRDLQAQMAFRYNKNSISDITAEQSETWELVHEALGITKGRQPVKQAIAAMGVAAFNQKVEQLNSFVTEACGVVLRRPARRAVTVMVLECLASYLDEIGLPRTPSVMLRNVGQLYRAVDNCYPGYISCKMLHRIALMKVSA